MRVEIKNIKTTKTLRKGKIFHGILRVYVVIK